MAAQLDQQIKSPKFKKDRQKNQKYDLTRFLKITLPFFSNGIFGWGEGYGPAEIIKAAIEFFIPFIVGKNSLEHETIWNEMYQRSLDFGRRGIFLSGLSAIDIALWDIKGKYYGYEMGIYLKSSILIVLYVFYVIINVIFQITCSYFIRGLQDTLDKTLCHWIMVCINYLVK